jgi:hypothetical protein
MIAQPRNPRIEPQCENVFHVANLFGPWHLSIHIG